MTTRNNTPISRHRTTPRRTHPSQCYPSLMECSGDGIQILIVHSADCDSTNDAHKIAIFSVRPDDSQARGEVPA